MTYTLHQGDALSVLPRLPDDCVEAVITDPPYNSGGRTSSERTQPAARSKYVSSDAEHALASFAGDNRDQRSYVTWLSLVLSESLRMTKSGGHALVFCDWRQLPATSDALQVAGWTWQGTLVWHKPLARPRRGGFKANAEFIVWGSNGPYSPREVYLPGVFSASQPRGRQRRHITEKPVDGLMTELVAICPEDATVLDPFAGSGATGEAALRTRRRFLGVEYTSHYATIARDRLDALTTHGAIEQEDSTARGAATQQAP